MSEITDLARAKATFETLCRALDKDGWKYKKDEEKMSVECGARGDDLPIELTVNVDAERMLTILISHLPYVIQEDKRLDAAVAITAVNNMLADGCFDFDITTGHIFFRMTSSFIESEVGEELFIYLLLFSCKVVDEYNDKLLMLGKGMVSIQQFIASLNN